eukprot:7378346-Prymnesium_polylepis.1
MGVVDTRRRRRHPRRCGGRSGDQPRQRSQLRWLGYPAPTQARPPANSSRPSCMRSLLFLLAVTDAAVPPSLAGKTVYFAVTDRFARDRRSTNTSACQGSDWCGGTFRGLTSRLDYIAGMGFDCVWSEHRHALGRGLAHTARAPPAFPKHRQHTDSSSVAPPRAVTPVVKQISGISCNHGGYCGAGYHGYWAEDWWSIDSHLGTPDDLRALSAALHERSMCLVLDIVVNHVRPIHSTIDAAVVKPFDSPAHYHAINATAGETFE